MAYRRWGALVYTLALRGAGDPALAREITARAFADAWRPGLDDASLKTGIVTSARRGVRRAAAEQPDRAAAEQLMDRLVVRDELTDLGDPDRAVMLLLIGSDLDRAQIAERLDLPGEEVAAVIGRSLERMSARLVASRDER